MTNSRAKGKRAELRLAKILREHGFDARRGQQFSGSPDSPDIVHSIPGVHIECKHVERLNIHNAMEQAEADCGEDTPVVCHTKNRKGWLVTMKLEDWLKHQSALAAGADAGGNDFTIGREESKTRSKWEMSRKTPSDNLRHSR
jgi:Holliday junction resolvase